MSEIISAQTVQRCSTCTTLYVLVADNIQDGYI